MRRYEIETMWKPSFRKLTFFNNHGNTNSVMKISPSFYKYTIV